MRLVWQEILIYLLHKCSASHLLFSLYQPNASHFLFSLDHCKARLLLFSLVQDCVMVTTSCFHYNKTVWCQLPLILLYGTAFECSLYSFQKNIYRDVKDLRIIRLLRKCWATSFLSLEEWQRNVTPYTKRLKHGRPWLNSSSCLSDQ